MGLALAGQEPAPAGGVMAGIGIGILHGQSGFALAAQAMQRADQANAVFDQGLVQIAQFLGAADEIGVARRDIARRDVGQHGLVEAARDGPIDRRHLVGQRKDLAVAIGLRIGAQGRQLFFGVEFFQQIGAFTIPIDQLKALVLGEIAALDVADEGFFLRAEGFGRLVMQTGNGDEIDLFDAVIAAGERVLHPQIVFELPAADGAFQIIGGQKSDEKARRAQTPADARAPVLVFADRLLVEKHAQGLAGVMEMLLFEPLDEGADPAWAAIGGGGVVLAGIGDEDMEIAHAVPLNMERNC